MTPPRPTARKLPNLASSGQLPVPLKQSDGLVIAYAVTDAADAHLLEHRWYLDFDARRKMYARRHVRVGAGRVAKYLHRAVFDAPLPAGVVVDHINGLTLDNRRANLRVATIAQNAQNRPRHILNTSSRYRGVTWSKARGKWQAGGTLNGRFTLIGRFDNEDEAGAAAAAWRAEHMPFSAEALARSVPPEAGLA